ncbi:MAG: hypothetical protein ACRCT8_10725 [Lacipirellulaceae bacterium]
MAPDQTDLIQRVHASGAGAVLAITGGGTAALGRLCAVPGASATVLEGIVPYGAASLAGWLGHTPASACSEATARAMAMTAWRRACQLAPERSASAVGIGATAALATLRPKRGDHRLHAALQTATRTAVLTITLEKGRRTRADEEDVAAHAIVALLADAVGVRAMDLHKTPPGLAAELDDCVAPAAWAELLAGERSSVPLRCDGVPLKVLMAGSFNPTHAGHDAIARIAEIRCGALAVRELSVTNVDKPPLDFLEIRRRVDGLGEAPVLLTRATTFVEKARLAPGCVFAVGADTAERIGRGAYYGGDAARDAAIDEITRLGCRFLVFGRVEGDRFRELADLDLPATLRALCDGVGEAEFRADVSSSGLRA